MRGIPRKNKFLYAWRYYMLGKESYAKCMSEAFPDNVGVLMYMNLVCFVLIIGFSIFFAAVRKEFLRAGVYCISALVALMFYFLIKRTRRRKKVLSRRAVYALIALCYANIMWLGTYIGVWANNGKIPASSFMSFLLVALLLFTTSPTFTLAASSCALVFFCALAVAYKDAEIWSMDVGNALSVYAISVAANWAMNKYRLTAALSAMELKEERDEWFSQSTIDPLSQLNNRLAFNQCFQRYLTSHRETDSRLSLAIIDIDWFKEYNDYYGHPKGDALIRALGEVCNDLQSRFGVFASRLGGDEFTLLWLINEKSNVDDVISSLQGKVEDLRIPHVKSKAAEIFTVSIGAYVARLDSPNTLESVYSAADKALYEAKRGGKNRAVIKREELCA